MREYICTVRHGPAKLAFPNGVSSYKSNPFKLGLIQIEVTAPIDGGGITNPSRTICQVFACRRQTICITPHVAAAFFCSCDHLTAARDNNNTGASFIQSDHTEKPHFFL